MTKIGIFFGSTTGTTEMIAGKIRDALEEGDLYNVADVSPSDLEGCDVAILGTSTWGMGDLQDDWASSIDELDNLDLGGKKVAVFGVGDQNSFSDTFVDGMGELYEKARDRGAFMIGAWPADGYDFSSENSLVDGNFVGLVIDENNQSDLTDERIKRWVAELKGNL